MKVFEASLPGVVRIILIIAAIYFLVRILGRLMMPLMRNGNSDPRSSARNNRSEDRKEGEVRIEYTDEKKQKKDKRDSGDGEYIDFEELD